MAGLYQITDYSGVLILIYLRVWERVQSLVQLTIILQSIVHSSWYKLFLYLRE